MCPIVRVVGGEEPEQVFIPIEKFPVVLSHLRKSLPELKERLEKKWPVESVHIEERRSYRKNPIDPSQLVVPACIGVVVIFGTAILKATGSKIGDAVGDGLKPYITKWVKAQFQKSKKPKGLQRKRRRRHAS
jgi:hypothetical protein